MAIALDSDASLSSRASGAFAMIVFGGMPFFFIGSFILNPQKAIERSNAKWEEPNSVFRSDLVTVRAILKHPIFVAPFILSLILIGSFAIFELGTGTVRSLTVQVLSGVPQVLVYSYLLSFIGCSLYVLGYLTLGEIFQRKMRTHRHNIFTDLVIDYYYAIPYIAILSVLWIVFIFTSGRKENETRLESIASSLRSFSIYALLITMKYLTFSSLAMIALNDRRNHSFKEASEFMLKHSQGIVNVWIGSGYYLMFIFIGLFFSSMLSSAVPEWVPLDSDVIFPIFLFFTALYFFVHLMFEQIRFLIFFLSVDFDQTKVEKLGFGKL